VILQVMLKYFLHFLYVVAFAQNIIIRHWMAFYVLMCC